MQVSDGLCYGFATCRAEHAAQLSIARRRRCFRQPLLQLFGLTASSRPAFIQKFPARSVAGSIDCLLSRKYTGFILFAGVHCFAPVFIPDFFHAPLAAAVAFIIGWPIKPSFFFGCPTKPVLFQKFFV